MRVCAATRNAVAPGVASGMVMLRQRIGSEQVVLPAKRVVVSVPHALRTGVSVQSLRGSRTVVKLPLRMRGAEQVAGTGAAVGRAVVRLGRKGRRERRMERGSIVIVGAGFVRGMS